MDVRSEYWPPLLGVAADTPIFLPPTRRKRVDCRQPGDGRFHVDLCTSNGVFGSTSDEIGTPPSGSVFSYRSDVTPFDLWMFGGSCSAGNIPTSEGWRLRAWPDRVLTCVSARAGRVSSHPRARGKNAFVNAVKKVVLCTQCLTMLRSAALRRNFYDLDLI